jgi:hypothetical protein
MNKILFHFVNTDVVVDDDGSGYVQYLSPRIFTILPISACKDFSFKEFFNSLIASKVFRSSSK